MALIWKKYDSKFNPMVMLVGLLCFAAGAYMLVTLSRALLYPRIPRPPFVWILATIPLVMGAIGLVTLIREYQLWKAR